MTATATALQRPSAPSKPGESSPVLPMSDHPIADIFPLMEGAEFKALVADVEANGLREPIVRYEGMILDGRNRHRACREAGVEPRFEEYDGDDPVGLVISKNIHRRHFSAGQRALVAARLANMPQGRPSKTRQSAGITQDDASTLLNVPRRAVQRAGEVVRNGAAELQEMLLRGDISVSAAEALARDHKGRPDRQREIVAQGRKRARQAARLSRTRLAAKLRKSIAANDPRSAPTGDVPAHTDTPEVPSIQPTEASASFRTSNEELAKLQKSFDDARLPIKPEDIIVKPDSESAKARPSLYALVRLPESLSKNQRVEIEQRLHEIRDDFHTQIGFAELPAKRQDAAGDDDE